MSKLTVSYDTATIESALTLKELETALQYAPKSNLLLDENKEPYFVVSFSRNAGSASKYGVSFDSKTADDHLFVSLVLENMPNDPEKRKETLLNDFGGILYNLNKVEAQIRYNLEARTQQIQTVADNIIIG